MPTYSEIQENIREYYILCKKRLIINVIEIIIIIYMIFSNFSWLYIPSLISETIFVSISLYVVIQHDILKTIEIDYNTLLKAYGIRYIIGLIV